MADVYELLKEKGITLPKPSTKAGDRKSVV